MIRDQKESQGIITKYFGLQIITKDHLESQGNTMNYLGLHMFPRDHQESLGIIRTYLGSLIARDYLEPLKYY